MTLGMPREVSGAACGLSRYSPDLTGIPFRRGYLLHGVPGRYASAMLRSSLTLNFRPQWENVPHPQPGGRTGPRHLRRQLVCQGVSKPRVPVSPANPRARSMSDNTLTTLMGNVPSRFVFHAPCLYMATLWLCGRSLRARVQQRADRLSMPTDASSFLKISTLRSPVASRATTPRPASPQPRRRRRRRRTRKRRIS